ncbi:PspC domain-containing protein [Sporolactobacillus sp. THM7-7]|nr:PspC domain-containing protein [Sporolactobacillus sp. THM7-7]
MRKTLNRSRKNRVLSGVLGGIGEYFNVDPTLIRLGYVILFFVTFFFPLILIYLFACIIIPEQKV